MARDHDHPLPVEQRAQIDRLADQFEREFQAGNTPRIEDYLEQLPALRSHRLAELLAVELELLRSAGQQPKVEEYRQRFRNDLEIVDAAFAVEGVGGSTIDFPAADDTDTDDEPTPKQIGRFQIQSRLGNGAFGVVYLAHDPQLDRLVALKVPRRKRLQTQEQVTNFIIEARTAAQLNHPGIVIVHDVQEHEGWPYIVQEYIDGCDLADWAAANPPSYQQIARLMVGIADAVFYAHQKGLTHCDLKLANVLMDSADQPHVADFGLAVHESVQELRKGDVFGTPAVMAPEQVRGESHRFDGRTDIWALGVMLYELLVGRRPFSADSRGELFLEIQKHDPKPPRQINRSIPRELERICLRCLSKRRIERYNTADDLREELQAWLDDVPQTEESTKNSQSTTVAITPDSSSGSSIPIKIIPKGLRSFDAEDADFFLELLPGPRDRNGLPESIRFWKLRIEETDPDKTFSVGLIYGPSGCGKSSLVKAGLIPRLSDSVLPIFVEATAEDTEVRLLKQLRKHLPQLPADLNLPAACTELRMTGAGRGRKVLLVIDQFEQWLHSHAELTGSQLVDALRQCEGGRLQAILLVRDDFYLSVNRLFRELEIRLVEDQNQDIVDLFDPHHARKVLAAFGRAYGRLGEDISSGNDEFLDHAIDDLAEDHKVISVRLALFADMMKGRAWEPASLQEVGGVGGVGETFLEETFAAKTAPPSHRVHEQAVRGVLKALLPEAGSDIKGAMQSREQLREAAGYAEKPQQFDELIQILDSEVRLITPTDPEGLQDTSDNRSKGEYYQLTHDYLVPSLRSWLTGKQKETRRGRAELRLADRSAAWNAKPDHRHLPAWWEFLNIRLFTERAKWTVPQQKMMRRARFVHGTRWGLALAILLISGVVFQQWYKRDRHERLQRQVVNTVNLLKNSEGFHARRLIEDLGELPPEMVRKQLEDQFEGATSLQKLPLAFALSEHDDVRLDFLLEQVREASTEEVSNFVLALEHSSEAKSAIGSKAQDCTEKQDWNYKTRLAVLGLHLGDTSIAAEMLRGEPDKNQAPKPIPNPLDVLREQLTAIDEMPEERRNEPAIRLRRATAYYYLDQPQDALLDLDEAFTADSAPSQALLLRALCLAQTGKTEEMTDAVKKFAEAVQDERYASYAASCRILTQAWLGNMGEANRQFDELLTKGKDDALTQYNAACIAAQLARIQERSNPDEAKLLKQRAIELLRRAYMELGYSGSSGIDNYPDLAPLFDDPEFQALVFELKPPVPEFDPIERTVFIREFPTWCGEIERLVELLEETNNAQMRSGINLAIGGIERPIAKTKDAWAKVLTRWYTEAPDSGTHSAAGWALRQWSLSVPPSTFTDEPSPSRDWWHPSEDLVMLCIPSGHLARRSSKPQSVKVEEFWLSDREVTVGLFREFISDKDYAEEYPGEVPSEWSGEDSRISPGPEHPVQKVSWYDAVMFCNWLSRSNDLEPCYEIAAVETTDQNRGRQEYRVTLVEDAAGYRLPTADEWEYACRASTTTNFACGNDDEDLRDYAVFAASRAEICGSKQCTAFGLFDMHGNVWEWVQDAEGSLRISRGGCWNSGAGSCQSSYRNGVPPPYRDDYLGFRVARGPFASQSSKPVGGAQSDSR